MEKLKILNKKETSEMLEIIRRQWGAEIRLDYGVLRNTKDKIYLAGKDVFGFDLTQLKISSIGMYFGEIFDDSIRLSIEGSQIVGPQATTNVVELSHKESREWLQGLDIHKELETKGFVIIRHEDDYLGCGKSMGNKILNYVPKARRVTSSD